MHTQESLNQLAYKIIGLAIEVHKELGPGLLESIYEECLFDELETHGIPVQRQVELPIHYKGKKLGKKLRLDLLVDNVIVVENKTVEFVLPVHKSQLLSHMKLGNKPKGILINFYTTNITKSATHLVNKLFADLPVR